jgi:hypothetical protein
MDHHADVGVAGTGAARGDGLPEALTATAWSSRPNIDTGPSAGLLTVAPTA